jgi:hypothetical protein
MQIPCRVRRAPAVFLPGEPFQPADLRLRVCLPAGAFLIMDFNALEERAPGLEGARVAAHAGMSVAVFTPTAVRHGPGREPGNLTSNHEGNMHPISFRSGPTVYPQVYEPAFDFPSPRFTFPPLPGDQPEHPADTDPGDPRWEEFAPRWWPVEPPADQ